MTDDDVIHIIPADITDDELVRLYDYFEERGPMPERARTESMTQYMARGRVADCDCG